MNSALLIHIIKVSIYLVAFLFCSLATGSVLWNNLLNPKKPKEAMLFFFLINFALTYLVGSLFIVILGLEVWIK